MSEKAYRSGVCTAGMREMPFHEMEKTVCGVRVAQRCIALLSLGYIKCEVHIKHPSGNME